MTERTTISSDGGRVLCLFEDDLPVTNIILQQQTSSTSCFSLLSQLEQYLSDCVDDQMIQQQQQLLLPLCYMPRADCSWLACQKPKRLPLESVLGIIEEQEEENDDNDDDDATVDREICFTAYRPCWNASSSSSKRDDDVSPCKCKVPHYDWNRVNLERCHPNGLPPPLFVEWVDLRWQKGGGKKQQQQPDSNGNNHHESSSCRDNDGDTSKSGQQFLLPTTAASCTHFLRSLLHTNHCASPWGQQQQQQYNNDDDDNNVNNNNNNKDVVILIINRDSSSTESSSSSSSCQPLLDYRVSDACPSWFLHAVLYAKKTPPPLPLLPPLSLSFLPSPAELNECIPYNQQQHQEQQDEGIIEQRQQQEQQAMFLIYRRLPPRDRLSVRHPITNEMAMTGCLWETYHVYPTLEEEAKNNKMVANGNNNNNSDDDDDDDETEHEQTAPATITEPLRLFRQVSPPYVNALVEYPGLLDALLLPESMAILQQECLQISHWTAWPEQQHYKATTTTNGTRAGENGAQCGGASWNVFPLLYCFPSNQVENKTWIEPTCAVVPRTVQLLKDHLGDTLRTALYSRLDPGAVLEAHTGWQDLANHVLRVHLPLVVPHEASGLAGLWVDGCVECHAVGRVVCFDDSKTHRAFNYSNESRIVLILDLAREPTGLPRGTAVGGHSEELDKFIEQMGTGSSSS